MDTLDINEILRLRQFCRSNNRKLYLANNIKLAINLNLNGVYIPAFNKDIGFNKFNTKKDFLILGSAHNIYEIKEKEKQGVEIIFLSPLFKTKKSNNYLDIHKFNNLQKLTNVKVIALGGINQNNYKKMRFINCFGMASISYIKMSPKIDNLLKIENGFKNRI